MKVHERAAQIWPLLSLAARNRQTFNYDMLGQLIGVPRAGLGQLLEPIQSYCLLNKLPALTSLVVSNDTGLPGIGFIAAQDIPGTHAAVFRLDWLAEATPTPEQFELAAQKLPSNGKNPPTPLKQP